MANDPNTATLAPPDAPVTAGRRPRIWPPTVLLVVFWAAYAVQRWTALGTDPGFPG